MRTYLLLLVAAILTLAFFGCASTAPQTAALESPDAAIAAVLKRTLIVLPEHTKLSDFVNQLRTKTGLEWVVAWSALEGQGLKPDTELSVALTKPASARTVLCLLRELLAVEYYSIDDIVVLTTTSYASSRHANTRIQIYDVTDLTRAGLLIYEDVPAEPGSPGPQMGDHAHGPGEPMPGAGRGLFGNPTRKVALSGARAIEKILPRLVAPDSWRENGGVIGSLYVVSNNAVLVVTTPEIHERIQALLASLRSGLKH